MMSALAEAIYEILRRRAFLPDSRLSYAKLAEELRDASAEFEEIHHRHRNLYLALGEVGAECQRLGLPPLPALVVRADTGRPGQAYYTGRCSGMIYQGEKVAAWRRDLEAVKNARYPRREPAIHR